ncbi:MAG: tyrosine-type recombinase/integrase [Desulfitobacteriaceae bacterium]|nr:tyrosine-type recombinase/integrase [Desulfitobacteriaceae bacterium]MDI6915746.1 tyrosine-type recombinase/integrase [Desulfitobacteriaceae bacterium]
MFTNWLDTLQDKGKSENTLRTYRRRLEQFAAWFEPTLGESLTPKRVTPMDLRDYKAYLQTVRKQAASTINLSLLAISSWLHYSGQTAAIPPLVRESKKAPQWLDRKAQHALLRALERVQDARETALILVMLHTGLRISEIAALDIEDLTITERAGELTVRQGKGDKVRYVPLNKAARQALSAYLGSRTHGPVFLSQRGQGRLRLTVSGIRQVVEKYAYLAKIPGLHPHVLRHTLAKNLLDVGVNLSVVAEILGHENLNTTAVYTRPSSQDKALAVEKLALH